MFILYSEEIKFIIPSYSYQCMYNNKIIGINIIYKTINRHHLLMFSLAYGYKVVTQLYDESKKVKDKTDQQSNTYIVYNTLK